MYDGLLLDIGDVIVNAPWEALDEFEAVTGRRVPGRGPYGADDDPLWQARLAGELTYFGYWDALAKAAGFEDWRQFFRAVTDAMPHRMFDDDALPILHPPRLVDLQDRLAHVVPKVAGIGRDRIPNLPPLGIEG